MGTQMKAKLAYLTILTLGLIALVVLLVLHDGKLPSAVDTILGGLLGALGLGAHAVFSDKSSGDKPAPPTQAAAPPKES